VTIGVRAAIRERSMTWLGLLLVFKILVTALPAVAPMLLLSRPALGRRLGIADDAVPYIRLYGVALSALLVGYASGLPAAEAGEFPTGVVLMGLWSNAAATLALWATGLHRRMPLAAPVFGAIAVGLAAALVWPELALQRAW
jgi:hypothetical protein